MAPIIDGVDPDEAGTSGGTLVTVSGSGFVPGQTTVTICGQTIPASAVSVTSDGTSLTFRAPACSDGDTIITVSTPAGASDGVTFRYVAGLPVTGSAIVKTAGLGTTLLLVGAGLLLLSRHRPGMVRR